MSTVEDGIEYVDYSTTSCLPNEILTCIFAHLPLQDRKNVKLVCSKWYACCTCLPISKNEKFVFRTGFSIEDAAKVMLKPNFSVLNLEFQGLPISSLPAYTWKTCGARIQSLAFHNCRWNDKTIKNIIIYCVNLMSFTIETSFCTAKHNLGNILCSPRLLNDLVRAGIRRTSLHTFTMFIDDVHLPESVLSKIFLIYPRLRHFSTGTVSHEDSFSYCLVLHIGKRPVFSRPDKCLNSVDCKQLERFVFNVPTDGYWIKTLVAEPDLKLRLKHFETMLIYDDSMKEALLKFFSSQKSLNVVKLGLVHCDYPALNEITFHILQRCPNLRDLRLKFDPVCLDLDWAALPRFITLISKLKVLTLNFDVFFNGDPFVTFQEVFKSLPQKNFSLTMLRLEQYELNDELSIVFLQHCPALEHLELSLCTDRTLQIIFKHLLKLQTLILNEIYDCTDHGFTGHNASTGYSIKRLRQLKYLDIRGYSTQFTEKLVLELELPCLEFFSINPELYRELSIETLTHLASLIPEIRVLGVDLLDDDAMIMKRTVEFCKIFKHLYRLICVESEFDELYMFDPESLEEFFRACPSLRYISDDQYNVLMYNPFTGKVLRKPFGSVRFHENIFDSGFAKD